MLKFNSTRFTQTVLLSELKQSTSPAPWRSNAQERYLPDKLPDTVYCSEFSDDHVHCAPAVEWSIFRPFGNVSSTPVSQFMSIAALVSKMPTNFTEIVH